MNQKIEELEDEISYWLLLPLKLLQYKANSGMEDWLKYNEEEKKNIPYVVGRDKTRQVNEGDWILTTLDLKKYPVNVWTWQCTLCNKFIAHAYSHPDIRERPYKQLDYEKNIKQHLCNFEIIISKGKINESAKDQERV